MSKFGRFWACPERRHLALPQSSPCHWLWLPCKCLPLSLLPLTALDQRWWGIFGHGRMMQMDPLSPLSPGDCRDTPTHPPQWGGAPLPNQAFPYSPALGVYFGPNPGNFLSARFLYSVVQAILPINNVWEFFSRTVVFLFAFSPKFSHRMSFPMRFCCKKGNK